MMRAQLILPNMMNPCQAMMILLPILLLDMLMVKLLAVTLQIKLPMRPDNVVTAKPLLLDPLLVATLLAATPSSAPAESWIVASPFALVVMEPACTPHV